MSTEILFEGLSVQTDPEKSNPFQYLGMPTTSFWALRANNDLFGHFPYEQVVPFYLHLVEQELSDNGAVVYGSAAADIAGLLINENNILPNSLTARLIPYRFAEEIRAIKQKARVNIKNGLPASVDFLLAQELMNGSDLDTRIAVDSEGVLAFSEQLAQETYESYEIPSKKRLPPITQGTQRLWRIPIAKGVFEMPPRNRIYEEQFRLFTDGYSHTPVIEIQSGYYPINPEFAFCKWRLIANASSYYPELPQEADIQLVAIDTGPQRQFLPEDARLHDTRSGNHINTFDVTLGRLINKIDELPLQIQNSLPDVRTDNLYYILPNGISIPVLAGIIDNNRYVFKEMGRPWVKLYIPLIMQKPHESDAYGSFIVLDENALRILHAPIRFGRGFGTTSAEYSFTEVLRVIRKAILYNGLDIANPMTDFAREHLSKNDIANTLKDNIDIANPTWWQIDATMNALVACFFDPKGCINFGKMFDLKKYFLNWHYLESVVDELPKKNQMRSELIRDSHLQTRKPADGLHIAIEAIRRKFSNDMHIPEEDKMAVQTKNDLELAFWLFTVGFKD